MYFQFCVEFWGKSADEGLISSIVAGANGAPVEIFKRIVLQKFNRATGRNHSTGLLPALAADAARAWKEEQAQQAAQAAETARRGSSRYSAMTPEELAAIDAEIEAEMRRPL